MDSTVVLRWQCGSHSACGQCAVEWVDWWAWELGLGVPA